mgnify:CR=1 FL=1
MHSPPETGQGRSDRRRVVGKIIVNTHSAHRAAQLETTFNVSETGQRIERLFRADADMPCGNDGRGSIGTVVLAAERPLRPSQDFAGPGQNERTLGIVAVGYIFNAIL